MGKLIVLEGIDGSGKSTQLELLKANLSDMGVAFRYLSFPRYDNESSLFVRRYLRGEMGFDPDAVNAYAASTFFAMDRYFSYQQDWGDFYNHGGVVITDRYTTSNAIHQAAKLAETERPAYWDWLYDYEFAKLALPKPDAVILLDISVEAALLRIFKRAESGAARDIHERDSEYLARCAETARDAAAHFEWSVIAADRDAETVQRDIAQLARWEVE
ncbi:MAG: deoxynucleoside kinase [Oscillospiraceae bacterium]|jgi:dTMP kinase|nr:deoxynucleoside kinase [Oscillospiraceae bacterium]